MGGAEESMNVGIPTLSLRSFGTGYGAKVLLQNVDADFNSGTLTAMLGRNGTGKSTTLRTFVGLLAYSGRVLLQGDELKTLSSRELARRVAFVGTERTRIPAIRCRDIVAMGRAPYTGWTGRLSNEDEAVVERSLKVLGMDDFAQRPLHTLSDGEFQRIMIARALAQDAPVMILDEPTSFLDLPNRYDVCVLLAKLAHEQNKCVIFTTHELDIAMALSDNIALIDNPNMFTAPTASMTGGGDIRRLFDPERRIPDALWNIRSDRY